MRPCRDTSHTWPRERTFRLAQPMSDHSAGSAQTHCLFRKTSPKHPDRAEHFRSRTMHTLAPVLMTDTIRTWYRKQTCGSVWEKHLAVSPIQVRSRTVPKAILQRTTLHLPRTLRRDRTARRSGILTERIDQPAVLHGAAQWS